MKKFIAIIIAITILTISMTACEASDTTFITHSSSSSNVQPIEDYRRTTGWNEGEVITTPEGHYWIVENPNNYMGYVEVSYDGRGTATLDDDMIILIVEVG